MRATADNRTVVGVFRDVDSAERAVEALRQAQFPASEIGVEEGGHEAAGLVGTLISMGVPENESRAYDVARSAGRALVTVRSAGRQAEAQVILRRSAALAVDELVPVLTTGSYPVMTGENPGFGIHEP
jgi:hypothetical protein